MSKSKHALIKLSFQLLTIVAFFISSMVCHGKEPFLEYLFNETGTYANSSGLDNTPLVFKKTSTETYDMHTEGGLGVSGSPADRAFDNFSWCEPFKAGIAEHEEVNETIPQLKSLTIQGWFKTDRIQGTIKHPSGSSNIPTLIKGPFMLDMTTGETKTGLILRVGSTSVTSALSYGITNEWVFFAVTYDKSKSTNNVNFYIGTRAQSVELVSTHTLAVDFRTDLRFTVGGQLPNSVGMFYGLLDNIRLYGSTADATGVLTIEELEQVRSKDLFLIPDPSNSTIEVSPRISVINKSINVVISVKDSFGTEIPGQTVKLEKTGGNIDFEPVSAVTDGNGKAIFTFTSPVSGSLTFDAIMESDYILGSGSIEFISRTGTIQMPIFEYLFDEIGVYVNSSGTDNTPLVFDKNRFETYDMHTEGGGGVSGASNDRAFDNYSWCEPFKAGVAKQEEVNTTIPQLKSLTIQGWYKMDQIQGTLVRDGKANEAVLVKGPFMLEMTTNATTPSLNFRVRTTRSVSSPVYGITNEWVFFAVTYDKTKSTNNLNFYIGTKAQSVDLVSTHTLVVDLRDDIPFTLGGHNPIDFGMFYGLLDNIRLYGSLTDDTGVLTLDELEQIRTSDILLLPDPFASIVEADSTVCIADGKDVASITVHVIDENGNNLDGATVVLTGDENFEPISKATGPDGKAIFPISSIKSGIVNFTASVVLGNNFEPIVIQDKVSVEFIQAVDSTKSAITGEIEPVSADGESEYIVKINLIDYDDQAIDGRNVTLTVDSTDFIIVESEKVTGSEGENPGEASFAIKANESLNANVTATVEPDQEDGEPITFELPIEFVGRLLVEGDGEEYSKILKPQRILAPGLSEDKIAENQIPNDGVSRMEVVVQLVDSNGAVSDRLVHIYEEVPQLELGDIQPAEVRTDSQGVVRFQVSTVKELAEALSTNIKIKVLNDKANWFIPIQFIPDNFGLWVTGTIPEANTEEAEVDEPFIITFNNPIKLVENVTKITLTPDPGSPGNPKTIIDIYEGVLDNNWLADGHSLEWQHPRLTPNAFYTAELVGIEDLNGKVLIPYTWRFMGTDTTSPEILVVDGKIAVQPAPWAVQVETDSELRIQFTEPLVTDEVGYPVGLDISLQPTGSLSFQDYDSINCEAVFLLENLQPDTTYSITVSGARDFAGWVMKPVTWNFSTIAQPDSPPKVINLELVKNITGDTEIDTDIKIYFNKSLRQTPAPEMIVTDMDTGTSVSGKTNLIENVCLVFIPEQDFGYDTFYKIELNDVCDEEGISLEGWEEVFLTEVQVSEIQSVEAGVEQYTLSVPQPTGEEVSLNILVPEAVLSAGTKMQVRNVHTCKKKELAKKAYYKQMSVTPAIYELLAYEQEESITGRINGKLTVEIPYTDNGSGFVSDLSGSLLVPEQSLKAFFWNDQTKEWLPLKSTVNTNDNTVSCEVDSFGILGLFGEISQATVYLSEVKLTANPIAPGSNGVRSETTFKFRLAYDSKVTLTLYDRSGRLVATLLDDEVYAQGYNGYSWDGIVDGRMLRPGLYVYRLFVRSIDPSNPDVDWTSGVLGIKY